MLKRALAATIAAATLALGGMAAAQNDPVQIVYIPKNTGNPYFDSLVAGFEKACAKLGCEFSQAAPATAEATSQILFITAQIQRGLDVIAISPNSPDALNQVLDRAQPGHLGQRRHRRQRGAPRRGNPAGGLYQDRSGASRTPGLDDRLRRQDRDSLGHDRRNPTRTLESRR